MSSNVADEQQAQTDYFRDELFTPNAVSDSVPQHDGQEPHNGNPSAENEEGEEAQWITSPIEGAIYQPHEASGWFLEPEQPEPHVARLGGSGAPQGYGPGSAPMQGHGGAGQSGMGGGHALPPGADPLMPPGNNPYSGQAPSFDMPPMMGAPTMQPSPMGTGGYGPENYEPSMPMQGQQANMDFGSSSEMPHGAFGTGAELSSNYGAAGHEAGGYAQQQAYGNPNAAFEAQQSINNAGPQGHNPAMYGQEEAPPAYFNPFSAQDPDNPLHTNVPDDPLMPLHRMHPSRVSPPAAMETSISGLPQRLGKRSSSGANQLPIGLGDIVASSLSPAAGLSGKAFTKTSKKKRKPVF